MSAPIQRIMPNTFYSFGALGRTTKEVAQLVESLLKAEKAIGSETTVEHLRYFKRLRAQHTTLHKFAFNGVTVGCLEGMSSCVSRQEHCYLRAPLPDEPDCDYLLDVNWAEWGESKKKVPRHQHQWVFNRNTLRTVEKLRRDTGVLFSTHYISGVYACSICGLEKFGKKQAGEVTPSNTNSNNL